MTMPHDELGEILAELLVIVPIALMALAAVWLAGCLKGTALRNAPPRDDTLDRTDLVIGLALFLVGATGAGWVLNQLAGVGSADAAAFSAAQYAQRALLSQAMIQLPLVLYVVIRAVTRRGALRRVGLLPSAPMRQIAAAVAALLVAVPMVLAINTIAVVVGMAMGCSKPETGHKLLGVLQHSDSLGATVGLIGSAVLVAPVLEEVIFRGLVQTALLDIFGRSRRWAVILLASFIFTVVHVDISAPQALGGLFVLAVILGWLYERYGSLLPCILVHMGFNVVNILLLFTLQ